MGVFLPGRNASSAVIACSRDDRESKDHQNKIPSLKKELFANTLQKNTFTLIINSLIEAKKLSYQLFRDHLPQVAELAYPKNKTKVVFESIRIISKNFKEEFAPRAFWANFHQYRDINPDEEVGKVNRTKCGTTIEVLAASIFGNALICKDFDRSESVYLPFEASQVIEDILSIAEENLLKIKKPDTFYTYLFSLNSKDFFPGHSFVVLQDFNEAGDPCYHFFQSYVSHYTLNTYLKPPYPRPLTHLQFNNFLKELEHCMTSPTWTQPADNFFRECFGNPMINIGCPNPCSRTTFRIRCGEQNLNDFVLIQEKFQASKAYLKYPEFKKTRQCSQSVIFCNQKKHAGNAPFLEHSPHILTVEGNNAQTGINIIAADEVSLYEQIRIGSSLLESFSTSEFSGFYDSYHSLISDWLVIFSKVIADSVFFAELRNEFQNFDFSANLQEESKNLAECFQYYIFNSGKNYFYYSQHFLSACIESIAKEIGEEKALGSSDAEFQEIFSRIATEQGLNLIVLSKKEVLGVWFYQMLLRFLTTEEIIEKKKIQLGTEILFPLAQSPGISTLEKTTFILMPLLLSTTMDNFDASIFHLNYALNRQTANINKGLNSYVLKICSLSANAPLKHTTLLLFEKAFEATKRYPYLKSKFLYSILAPLTMYSTFESSSILSLGQKNELRHYSEAVLHLYDRYFDEVSNETIKQRPGKKKEYINAIHHLSTGQNALKFLEKIYETPDQFSKFVEFQLQCMKDLLHPCRRHNDLKQGKHEFLPHVGINTPFIEARTHHPFLKAALNHTRNYQEFLFVAYYFKTQNFTKLCKKFSVNEIVKLIEKLIQEIIHKKIHPSLLEELHEGRRYIKHEMDLKIYIQATGLPAIMDDFFAFGADIYKPDSQVL